MRLPTHCLSPVSYTHLIIFDKGQVYKIDKIKDICRRAADVGGVGDRYTCMIQGKERELWFEDGRWFVAAKVINEKTH